MLLADFGTNLIHREQTNSAGKSSPYNPSPCSFLQEPFESASALHVACSLRVVKRVSIMHGGGRDVTAPLPQGR